MEIKKSSEAKPESSEIVKTISKKCISCKNDLPNKSDRGICPHCGIKNK